MTDKRARILQFILDRKKLITAKELAKHFCIAQSTAATHLRELNYAGHITRKQIGTQIFWGKHAEVKQPEQKPEQKPVAPVAVPEEPVAPVRFTPDDWEPPKPIWPANPFKTSYPHVRGYDD